MPEPFTYQSYGGTGKPPTDDFCRWCVYCGADCWVDSENQEHHDDCPAVTGRYPLGGEPDGGPAFCGRCEKPLVDYYRHVRDGDAGDVPIYLTVCDDCAFAALVND